MNNSKLQPIQMGTFVLASILGVDILWISRQMASMAGHDGWLPMLLGGILAVFAGLMLYAQVRLYPGHDFPETQLLIAGKVLGRILFLIPATIYLLLFAGYSTRIFAEAIKNFLLHQTPILFTISAMALVAVSVTKRGIYALGRVIDILLPVILFSIILLLAVGMPRFEPGRLEPILYRNTGSVLKSIIPAYNVFIGQAILGYILPHIISPKSSLKWYLAGSITSVFIYTAMTLVILMTFGPEETQTILYPFLGYSKSIDFPATLLERFEAVTAIVWIGAVFLSVAIYTYASTRSITVLFGFPKKYEKYVTYAHLPILIAIALSSRSAEQSIRLLNDSEYIGTALALCGTPFLLAVAFIKKKNKKEAQQ